MLYMDEKEILAKNLIKYRKNAGLSQIELAKKLNYSNKNISKWENGETMPNAFVLQKIANIYGIQIEDLIKENGELIVEETPKSRDKRKTIFRITMLLLANAILYASGTLLIYILKLVGVKDFPLYMIYLYLSPLSFLSITIYIRVIYNIVEIFSMSAFNWLICTSFYLSFINTPNMAFIFVMGGGVEIIEICISLLVNIKLKNDKKKALQTSTQEESKQE